MCIRDSLRPALDLLTYAEKGEIFDAILAYGEDGTVPDLSLIHI